MFGDAGTVGKPVGADLKEGKVTFLIHHALSASSTASPEERELLRSSLGDADLDDATVERVCRLLETTGARAAVTRMVAERLQAAREALAGLTGLEPESRLFFEGLVGYLWEREQ
jgi:geranylgeranyl diphosphate synthase type I